MVSLNPLATSLIFNQKDLIPSAKFQNDFASIPDSIPETREQEFCLSTNELDQMKTLDTMKREPLVGDALLSVSTFHGLNVFAARGKKNKQTLNYIIMIDNSLRVQFFWKEIQKIVSECSLKEDAFKAVKSLILEQSELFWNSSLKFWSRKDQRYKNSKEWTEEAIQKLDEEVCHTKLSWLSTQKRYEKVKRVFEKGHFVFKCIDLCDHAKVRILSKVINELGITLDTVYISNIPEWVEAKQHLPFFYRAINELRQSMTNQTLLIDTKPRPTRSEPLMQRVRRKIRTANLQESFPPTFQSSEFALSSIEAFGFSGLQLKFSLSPLLQQELPKKRMTQFSEIKSNMGLIIKPSSNESNVNKRTELFLRTRKCSLSATLAVLFTPLQKCRDCFSRFLKK